MLGVLFYAFFAFQVRADGFSGSGFPVFAVLPRRLGAKHLGDSASFQPAAPWRHSDTPLPYRRADGSTRSSRERRR